MNLKGQIRYRATHKESLSTNKLNQNILFTKNKKLINTMQCPLSLSQMETMTLNSNKEMMPMHFIIINKDLEYGLTCDL